MSEEYVPCSGVEKTASTSAITTGTTDTLELDRAAVTFNASSTNWAEHEDTRSVD